MSGATCPNCRGQMELLKLSTHHAGLEIDACYGCHAFWFDNMESPGLSPASVIALFQKIREHRDAARMPLGARLGCARCRATLLKTQDIQGTNRIEYFRCPDGHGRFTPFFQFLREKRFVRSLSPQEMKQLRVEVSQVRCSSCGAVVSLEKGSACLHCGASVSVLDADAMDKALLKLGEAAARRPQAPIPQPLPARVRRPPPEDPRRSPLVAGYDLLDEAIGAFVDFLDN